MVNAFASCSRIPDRPVIRAATLPACLFAACLVSFLLPRPLLAAPAEVGTSSAPYATGYSAERKTFYDPVNGRHWVFWQNGSAIAYAYSIDGSVWTPAGAIINNTIDFSLAYKRLAAGHNAVLIIAEADDYDIMVYPGLVNANSIAFGTPLRVFDGSAAQRYLDPTVAITSDDDIFYAAIKDLGQGYADRYQAYAVRMSEGLGSAAPVGRRSSMMKDVVLLAKPEPSQVYLLINSDAPNIVAYEYDGTAWSELNTGGDYSWFSFPGGVSGEVRAMTFHNGFFCVGGAFSNASGNPRADSIACWNDSRWTPLGNGISGTVDALESYGGALYAAGSFNDVDGDAQKDNILRWQNNNWYAMPGISNRVRAIAIYDGAVHIGGDFSGRIARWNGSAWIAVGGGLNGIVYALKTMSTRLYAGGTFTDAGGIPAADRFAYYSGGAWNAAGSGIADGTVYAIAAGSAGLYVGGNFSNAGGIAAADGIARFDGMNWHDVGGLSLNTAGGEVVYGIWASGSEVYIGGKFANARGVSDADQLAYFDGTNWHGVGGGVTSPSQVNTVLKTSGKLYVGGRISAVNGDLSHSTVENVAVWDNIKWSGFGLGGFKGSVYALEIFHGDLIAGGEFLNAWNIPEADNIVRWDGIQWRALGPGLGEAVHDLTVFNDRLYAGGAFENAGGVWQADYLASWNGSSWSAPAPVPLNGAVNVLEVVGDYLYAGGEFSDAGGIPEADYLVRNNGTDWSAVGSTALIDTVEAIAGQGSTLFIGGSFSNIAGIPGTAYIGRFDGAAWQALGTGMSGRVTALAVSGTDLYAAGPFNGAGGVANTRGIARWDGTSWHPLGTGILGSVWRLACHEGRLYAGGNFSNAGGSPQTGNLAVWDGSTWSGFDPSLEKSIGAIAFLGSSLYVGGSFTAMSSSYGSHYLARWDRSAAADIDEWSEMSAASDAGGAIHLLYRNRDDFLRYRKFDSASRSWQPALTLDSSGSASAVNIAVDNGTRNVYAFFTAGGSLRVKPGAWPHGAASWSNAATITYPSPYPWHMSVEPAMTPGGLCLAWTDGEPGPLFRVLAGIYSDYEGDGIFDDLDDDDDNDSLSDAQEAVWSTDRFNPDTDADGVSDGQEVADGSSPTDRGSFLSVLDTTVCAEWNGFLGGMWNIAEHVNMSGSAITVETTLYDINGVPRSSETYSIEPGRQFDLLVHDMPGWTLNSYGKVCSRLLSGSRGDLDGRMVYYKEAPGSTPVNYLFEFAFAMPFLNGIRGEQFVPFNTFQPSLDPSDAGNPVANWIQITNLENTPQEGRLNFYGRHGLAEFLGGQGVALAAGARQDYSGHQFGPNRVGIVQWQPDSSSARFQLRNVRYFYDNPYGIDSFETAFQLEGMVGSGQVLAAALDTSAGSAILEVANTSTVEQRITVDIYNAQGTWIDTQAPVVPAFGSEHIITDNLLRGAKGVVVVRGSLPASVIAFVMQYARTPSLAVDYLFGVAARQPLGASLRSSYNTFLNQGCRLLAVNPGESAVEASLGMTRYDGAAPLVGLIRPVPAHGLLEYDLCAHEAADAYGVASVDPASPGTVAGVIIRRGRNHSYEFPVPVRQ